MNSRKLWVNQLNRVGSKKETKIFSLVFAAAIILASVFFFSLAEITVASDITVEKIVQLTNASRAGAGESALIQNSKLLQAAQAKAEDMIANNYFSHTSPSGATPWKWIQEEEYDYIFAGENLAMDFHSSEKMEDAWMASPTHRANILNQNYHEIGVSVKKGNINGHETILAVVMFGSGDKNGSITKEENQEKEILPPLEVKKNIPKLYSGEEKKSTVRFEDPVVTSPKNGEIFSDSEIKIIGRAQPGEAVMIFDNENLAGSAVADPQGWFSLTEKELSEGTHKISLQGENMLSKSISKFLVDRKKPDVDFHLYADKNSPSRFFLEASANKDNCLLQFNGEARYVMYGNKAVFAVDSGKSSAILRVLDEAGNKNFKQINIANYYFGSGNDVSKQLANFIFPTENIFVSDSGRQAISNNLGLVSHQLLASQITKK